MKRAFASLLALLCVALTPMAHARDDVLTVLEYGYEVIEATAGPAVIDDASPYKDMATQEERENAISMSIDIFSFEPHPSGIVPHRTAHLLAVGPFERLHPTYRIERVWYNSFAQFDRLYTELLTGKLEADILHYQDLALRELYEAGAIVDLVAHAPIKKALEAWPPILNLLGDGEHLYALPDRLMPVTMEISSRPLYDNLQLDIDDMTWTWQELFALGDLVEAYNRENDDKVYLLSIFNIHPQWLYQYTYNTCFAHGDEPPDEEELRVLLSGWKSLRDRGLILDNKTMSAERILKSKVLFGETNAKIHQAHWAGMLMMPTYREGIARCNIMANYHAINASSPHVEQALDLLACLADPVTFSQSEYYYSYGILLKGYPAVNDTLNNLDFWMPEGYVKLWEEDAQKVERPKEPLTGDEPPIPMSISEIPPALAEKWNEVIGTGYLVDRSEIYASLEEIFRAFMAEQIGLEECVGQMVQRINMLTGE